MSKIEKVCKSEIFPQKLDLTKAFLGAASPSARGQVPDSKSQTPRRRLSLLRDVCY